MRLVALAAVALAAVAVAACTETVQLAHDPLADLVAIAIDPATTTVAVVGLGAPPQTVAYRATGTFADGTARDITSLVAWDVDDPYPGAFAAAGAYATSGTAGGSVTVTARGDTVTATAQLAVVLTATIVDAKSPPPAPDAFTITPVTGDPMHSPALLYPSPDTTFPQGVATTLVRFAPGAGNDTTRIAFECGTLHLFVLTGDPSSWTADGAAWSAIAESCLGTQVAVTLEATASLMPTTVYASAPTPLAFARDAPGGVVYFRSARTNGIWRGALDGSLAPIYPADGTPVCCHAVSRDGVALAASYGPNGYLRAIALPSLAPTIGGQLAMGWAAYSPDGKQLVVADNGALVVRDAATGAFVAAVALPAMRWATHPDWSPDGSALAVALTPMMPSNTNVQHASIAILPYASGAFGAPQIVVQAAGMDDDLYPKWSPDGGYLAYVHATSATNGELYVVRVADGTTTQLTTLANVSDATPTWAPIAGERAWLAFASSRPYGMTMNTAQLWIVAVDLAGGTPAAPFWLPGQDPSVAATEPVWAAVPPPVQ